MKYIFLLGLFFGSNAHLSFGQTKLPPKKPVFFHQNHYVEKMDPNWRKQTFYMIVGEGNRGVLRKVNPTFELVNDECLGKKVTYIKVAGIEDPMVPILSAELFSEKPSVTSAVLSTNQFLAPTDKINLQLGGENYVLSLKKNKIAKDSMDIVLTYKDSTQSLNRTALDPEYPPTIIFAGDLDNDSIPEMIIQVYHQNGIYWILYKAEKTEGAKPRFTEKLHCPFTALPC
jgi:hypothetical protein